MDEAKPRFPRDQALAVCRELVSALRPACLPDRLIIAGSLRRRKEEVGDVEVLFIPAWGRATPAGQLFPETVNLAENAIAQIIHQGVLRPRLSKDGREAMGPKNKLTVHCSSGIPVDLFTASQTNWWNYLVCRTGGAQNNVQIATRAKERGFQWNPYDSGFTRLSDQATFAMKSEREVFEFLGLPYLEPWERE